MNEIKDRCLDKIHACVRQKDLSKQKIIKTYCYNVFKEMFTFLFLFFNSLFFSSLILNKYIYIMLIMSSFCLSLHFFTKRNDREKIKTWREKREEIYIAISQPVEWLWSWNFLHILGIISAFYESRFSC